MFQSVRHLIQKALEYHKRGDFSRAKSAYEQVLDLDRKNFDAHHLLGVLYIQTGNLNKGLKFIDKAIEINPNNNEIYFNKAEALFDAKRLNEALPIYQKLIKANVSDHDVHKKIISILREIGQLREALSYLDRLVNQFPDYYIYYHLKGDIFYQLGHEEEAIAFYSEAIKRNPNSALSYNNRAIILKQNGQVEAALEDLILSTHFDPFNYEYHFNLGNLYKSLNKFDMAIKSYHEAIAINENYLEAHFNLANTYLGVEKFAEAAVGFDNVIRLDAEHVQAHRNRGIALQKLSRRQDALESFDKAIELGANFSDAFLSRSEILGELGKFEKSIDDKKSYLNLFINKNSENVEFVNSWIALLQVDAMPTIFKTQNQVYETRQKIEIILDHLLDKYSSDFQLTQEQIGVANRAITLFNGFFIAYHQMNDRKTMKKIAKLLQRLSGTKFDFNFKIRRSDAPIRLGIASQRLRNHNGANWAYNWLKNLPQNEYQFFTYNFEAQSDDLSKQFSELGIHRQVNLDTTNHSEVINLVRNDNLDLLMLPDVGMTPISRILSINRLAPHQFTAWGHPVTTGSSTMDYYLSSDLMEPADGQDHYTEKLIRMPNLALYIEPRKPLEPSHISHRFPSDRVRYGCVQSLFKYIPKYDEIFPLIASQVPNAQFIFINSQYDYMTNILKDRLMLVFEKHGLEFNDYVRFIPGMGRDEFSNLISQMDVCIDSVGWSGGNTTIECVELSVPFVTFKGEFMRGRHSYAILKMMRCEELIAETINDYVEKLVKLGRDRDYRNYISDLFKSRREMIYEDKTFVKSLHKFLASQIYP